MRIKKEFREELEELWSSCKEYLPTEGVVDLLKKFSRSLTELDLSGLEAVTDEVFHALLELKAGENLTRVTCAGCVHITDFGIALLAQAAPKLSEVILDGCIQLSSLSLHHLVSGCEDLKLVSVCGTFITHLPPSVPASLSVKLQGCPLISQPEEGHSQPADDELSQLYKLAILADPDLRFSVRGFLCDGSLSPSEDMEGSVSFSPNVQLDNIKTFKFNIYESHMRRIMYAPFLSERTAFIFAIEFEKNDNSSAWLDIMTLLSEIHGQVLHSPMHVLCFHDGANGVTARIEKLAEEIRKCHIRQRDIFDGFLNNESYLNSEGERDFLTQVRYSRALNHRSTVNTLKIYALNTKNQELELIYPKVSAKSAPGDSQTDNSEEKSDDAKDQLDFNLGEVDVGLSIEDLHKEREAIQTEAEKILSENMDLLESVNRRIDSLSKADITEVKSFKSPPVLVKNTVGTVALVLGELNDSWESAKMLLSRPGVILDLRQFDKDALTGKKLKIIKEYVSNPEHDPDKLNRISRLGATLCHWLHHLYKYHTQLGVPMKVLKEKMRQIDETIAKMNERKGLFGKGPGILRALLKQDVQTLHEKTFPHLRITKSNLIAAVEAQIEELKSEHVVTFSHFVEKLSTEGSYSTQACLKALQHLHKVGTILFWEDVPDQPIVTDVTHVLDVLTVLHKLPDIDEFRNGRRVAFLGDTIPIFTQEDITGRLSVLTSKQVGLVFSILEKLGIITLIPCSQMSGASTGDIYYYTYSSLSGKTEGVFMKASAKTGVYSSSQFVETFWGTDKSSYYYLEHCYRFLYGMPLSLMPLIQAECIQMGVGVHVYHFGMLVRHASVEIYFKININLSLQIKGIDVLMRTNKGGVHHVKLEHAWSIFSQYLLIIDNLAHRFQHIALQVRQPCRGEWCEKQDPSFFSASQIPRRMGNNIKCTKCLENSMSIEESDMLRGRQRFLPFHNFVDRWDPRDDIPNPGVPYSCSEETRLSPGDSKWKCFVCSLTLDSAKRLWEKEISLYPNFVSSSLVFPQADPDSPPVLQQRGNLLSLHDDQASGKPGIAFTKEVFNMSGFVELSLTVMSSGKIKLAIGGISWDKCNSYNSVEDFIHSPLLFHLDSGLLEIRDSDHNEEQNLEPIGLFDTLSIQILDEFHEGDQKSRTVLKKNGKRLTSVRVLRHKAAILMEPGADGSSPKVMVHCPTMPVVRAHHFPLGSALYYKLPVSQQWTLGQVVASVRGKVVVGDKLDTNQTKESSFEPSSTDILPITCHMNTATVIIGKGIARNNQEYLSWMNQRGAWPTPTGLFTAFYQNMQSFNVLRIGGFEFDSWRCMSSRHSPQVLNCRMYKNLHMNSWKAEKTFLLLPDFSKDQHLLYNPHVCVAHNMDNQTLHTICSGGKISGLGRLAHTSDVHFLGIPPKQLTGEEAEAVSAALLKGLIHIYLSMSVLDGVFMPFEDVPEEDLPEFEKCLRSYNDIYLATFLLQNWLVKFESGSKSNQDYENIIEELTKAAEDVLSVEKKAERLTKLTKKGVVRKKVSKTCRLCECHQNINKPVAQRNSNPPNEVEAKYARFVRSVPMKNSHLNMDLVKRELTTYTNLLVLNIPGCRINKLPGLDSCPLLTYIDISRNAFEEVPAEIAKLSQTLQCLDIAENPINRFPDFITSLTSLVKLSASYIRELPEDFGKLSKLHTLNLKQLMVIKLPESFSQLQHLEDLSLDAVSFPMFKDFNDKGLLRTNWLALYNKSRGHITFGLSKEWWEQFYDSFDVNGDKVLGEDVVRPFYRALSKHFPRFGHDADPDDPTGGFPMQVLKCHRLRFLILSHHAFKHVPDEISQLKGLVVLNVRNNADLETVGIETGKLMKLKELSVVRCTNLRTPPPEIVAQGNNTLIAYLRRLSQGSVSCYRTKLMFVGLGGAGKTSLMRALMSVDGRCPVTEGEGITDGIDISAWTLPHNGKTYTFSVWDFAGQTVYYNTHQFFLSKRAVYMLIWNTRLGYEHSGLKFWLASIACHSPKAPIFVIGTHADQISKADLPEDKLKKTFPNIVGFISVSSTTGKGVEELRSQFLSVAANQPYMGEQIPEAWLSLERLILSERSSEKKLLAWKEVVTLAEKAAITGQEIRRAVLFLHELGTLQYFDNELLRDRVVINPQWIVDVMACVVSVHDSPIKEGYLNHSDVAIIWKKYPKQLHPWLLRLTEVFDLTFPLPDSNENIVPCLLPQREPPYDWPVVDDDVIEMLMYYKFDYLPAGLFNRAQVRLYQFSDRSAMWKEGSVLKKNENTGLIKQTAENELMVKVAGVRPENVVLLVHEVIEGLITEFFQGVKYEYQLPCMDCLRVESKHPAMFSSRVMNRAIQMKALFLQCHAFFHTLSISEMQAIMPPASNTDYALQLEHAIEKLDKLQEDLATELFFMYCPADRPENVLDDTKLHPRRLMTDLEAAGIKCCYEESLLEKPVGEIMMAMRNSKMCLIFISNKFVEDVACQRLFYFMLNNLKIEFILLMVGESREWQTSDIGGKVTEHVYINFQRMSQYQEKLQELLAKLNQKLNREQESAVIPPDIFLSYCWSNSERSVNQRIARQKEGSLGAGDPRDIKDFLESNGFKVWIDLEQTGKAGLFEDIAAGMRKAKVVVACVSDEYVLSANCQMEFRFAHIALHKPIILVVVGTGFMWESTEIGMLSLGYPKVYFQVSNNLSHKMLLQYVQERVETSAGEEQEERPVIAASNSQKEMAFQELYELAQRKFLRQISSYMEPTDPYPRLFVVDLNFNPEESTKECDSEIDDLDIEILEKPEIPKKIVMEDLEAGMFSIKTLCEHEGGWHAVKEGVPLYLGGSSLKSLWQMVSPYMARILAILKHSPVNLHIIQHPEGNRIHRILEKKASIQPLTDLKPIYTAIRQFVMRKDREKKRGGLSRCHLPSGKVLWLCPKHQKQPRITVLREDEEEGSDANFEDNAEDELLAALSKLSNSTSEDTNQDNSTEVPSIQPEPPRQTSAKTQVKNTPKSATRKPEKAASKLPESAKIKKSSATRGAEKGVEKTGEKRVELKRGLSRETSTCSSGSRIMTDEEKNSVTARILAGANVSQTSQACIII